MRSTETEFETPAVDAPPPSSRNFGQILWQRKAFVILGALIGLAFGFLYHTQKTTMYSSSSQILVIKKRISEVYQQTSPGSSLGTLIEDYMSTHMVLLKSPLIIQQAIRKRDLGSLKSFDNVGDPVTTVQQSLSVARDSGKDTTSMPNNVLLLSYRGPVSEDCGKILTAIVESYQDFLDITYKNVSDQTLNLIIQARETLKTDLAQAEEKYQKFRQESPLFWRNHNGLNVEQERVAAVEAKRSQMLLRLTELSQRMQLLDKAIKEGIGEEVLMFKSALEAPRQKVINGLDPLVEQPLIPLIVELNQLLELYGEEHPFVKSAKNRIETTRKQLTLISTNSDVAKGKDPAKVMLSALKFEYDEIEHTVRAMDGLLDKMKADAKFLSNFEIQESHLRNEMARLQLVYDGTIKRLQEINLVRDSGGFDARVLSNPMNGVKVAPLAHQDLPLGLMLGLMVGVGLAYLADMADKSFRSPEEIRKQLGLPLVGHIPYFGPDTETAERRAAGEPTVDPMLCCHFKPKSLDSEAYRAVRTSLFFATQGQGLKVIQVTSPNKGDGKSLLISNLAVTTAQSGKRVLMIDADCRRPRQHKVFNLPNEIGLATVLNGEVTPEQCIHETVVPGLSVMPAGPVPPNPSELLVSPRFKELLDSFRSQYDYIFVDTPPLLAVTDPCIVAGKVDGMFLAIRLTRKGRPDAERAREILSSLNVRCFGVVVNGVTRAAGGLYSTQAYDYSDKYINYEDEEEKAYYYADDDEPPAK